MRRRTFIQTLPLAAAGAAATMPDKANAQAQGVHATTIVADLPKFQAANAEKFVRPDVHRRRSAFGRELCHALACAGLERRRGNSASTGHANRDRDAEARRLAQWTRR